jgi:5-methylcytosine-specific restriction protein A
MPVRIPRPCRAPGCAGKSTVRHGYCEQHEHLHQPWTRGNAGQGRGGRPWRRLREQVLARDKHLCQCGECRKEGRARPATEVDHIVPKAEGGTDSPGNLQAINTDCHKRKTAKESLAARQKKT